MHLNLTRRVALVLAAHRHRPRYRRLRQRCLGSNDHGALCTPVPKTVATLKVALVAPSATNDLSWTQTMYAALESLKSSQHLSIVVSGERVRDLRRSQHSPRVRLGRVQPHHRPRSPVRLDYPTARTAVPEGRRGARRRRPSVSRTSSPSRPRPMKAATSRVTWPR